MRTYTYLIYRHFGHLLWDFFRGVKSIYKNETFTGAYKIEMPSTFGREHPELSVPPNAVAALSASFKYDVIDGSQEIMRHCFLDSSGYRIPDQSERPFNVSVDNWLGKIQDLCEEETQDDYEDDE
jgi:hypothetical protein